MPKVTPIRFGDSLSADDAAALAATFKAVADPTRLQIMALLSGCDEATSTQLAVELDSTQEKASHHLRILRAAGLADGYWQGTQLPCRLDVDALAEPVAWLTELAR